MSSVSNKVKKSSHSFPIIEISPRRVRIKFNDIFIADSSAPKLVIEYGHGKMPTYYFKKNEVKFEYLQPSDYTGRGNKSQFWHVKVGDKIEKNAAYRYNKGVAGNKYDSLDGYLGFKWNAMDHWYEEDEEIFLHPRDPYHRVDAIHSSRHVKVVVNNVTVADSTHAIFLFETDLPTRYYFPQTDIRMDIVETSATTSYCPYKGHATYWSVLAGDEEFKDIIWGYPEPIAENPKIKNRLAFWNEKSDKIQVYVDGKEIK